MIDMNPPTETLGKGHSRMHPAPKAPGRIARVISPRESRFLELMMQMLGEFQRLREQVMGDNSALRAEWRDARGLAAWTEDRLEVLEARLTRLEQAAHLPPLAAAAELRELLAGYGPSLSALGVSPRSGSAPEDAR